MTSPFINYAIDIAKSLRRMNIEKQRKELLKKWKALPEPKPDWESFKRRNQFQNSI